jgi:hypothetical protein
MKKWLADFPWTNATKGAFLGMAVLTWAAGLVFAWFGKEIPGGLFGFVLAVGGLGFGGMIGKRVSFKREAVEPQPQ